jgi:multiple sugar transport system permease protein
MSTHEGRTIRGIWSALKYVGLTIFAFITAFPLYYVFVLASWPKEAAFTNPPRLWFGPSLLLNLRKLLEVAPKFPKNYFNSVVIAVLTTATVIFFCTLVGFGFAKYRFKGRGALYGFVIATLSIPAFLNIIPIFKMMSAIGWYGTWLPLIVPGMAGAFGVFLMTQFLEAAVPLELLDAARIDGLSEYGIVMRIGFPLARSGIAVLGIVTFIGSWNEFFAPLVFLPNPDSTTLPVILSSLSMRGSINFSALMMGTALSIFPLLAVFAFFSRQIIAGLIAGSVKG